MANPAAGGRLTTHVLDTASGRPAVGVAITLRFIDADGAGAVLSRHVTNADGRCDAPILSGDAMAAGVYELTFDVGAYFRAQGVALDTPAFLDMIPIRFGLADAGAHYHVPLLVSPFGYSTYRGS
ncbi:MAG: hydroxyisourate hydrolase [Beijerinckiaceae bacterium]|jgi:5-hydroxyisourate hydrolase|nr:hydroxyisourate hydrolase [Beijerinckiaceae bacterium]MDO9440803.1 hydroxyisourate hydrolase [Beijerinckiaceae bacterium]